MKPHQQISELLKSSILQVAKRRVIHDFYRDDQESRKQYYFPTLEGLEAILIPAIFVKEARWPVLISEFPEIREVVSKDIDYILSLNTGKDKQQQGGPYFATGRRASTKYYWISECGAFTLSTLINVLTLAKLFPKDAPHFDHALLRETIEHNVTDLLDCAVSDGGWSWSKGGRSPDAWATWSAIETFTDYLSYTSKFSIKFPNISRVKDALANTSNYLRAQIDWNSPETISGTWHQSVYKAGRIKTPREVKCAYSFVQTMISSSLLGLQKHKQFRELAALLFDSVEKLKVKNVENWAKVASKDERIDDYSYNPTLLRALTSIYVEMDTRGRKDLRKRLNSPAIYYIHKQFDRLMGDYILAGDWAGLWGYHKNYEIYYTERMIEALVSLREFLTSWTGTTSQWRIPEPKPSTVEELQAELDKVMKRTGITIR